MYTDLNNLIHKYTLDMVNYRMDQKIQGHIHRNQTYGYKTHWDNAGDIVGYSLACNNLVDIHLHSYLPWHQGDIYKHLLLHHMILHSDKSKVHYNHLQTDPEKCFNYCINL